LPEIEPVMVRYLRIGEANGDGSYTVSEFAAYRLGLRRGYCVRRSVAQFLRFVNKQVTDPFRKPFKLV